MISLIKTVLRIIFISALIYTALFSIYKVEDDQLGIVSELDSGRTIYSFSNDINFIRHGLLPWIYRVETIPAAGVAVIEVKIPVTQGIAEAGSPMVLKIPLEVSYQVNRGAPPESDFFNSDEDRDLFLLKRASFISRGVLKRYLEPQYNRNGIMRDENSIIDLISSDLKDTLARSGLIIESVKSAGSMFLPSTELYRESLRRDAEMRAMVFENKKQEVQLKNKMEKERISTDAYYDNLSRMSSIIKENPDILKYIYIDKIAGNIKVIVSSEKSGIPVIFGQDQVINEPDLKKEIDNLR
jgi:hypothetical protein